MNIPSDLFYSVEHEWLRAEGNEAYIGITDFAQRELGDIVFVDIKNTGLELKKGEVFGTVEAVKTVSDLFMPVSGTILGINPTINEAPEQINTSPYEEGWMIRVLLSNIEELKDLMGPEAYKSLVG